MPDCQPYHILHWEAKEGSAGFLLTFSDAKLMQVAERQGGHLTFEDSVPVSNTLPKKIEDMSSHQGCFSLYISRC